MTPKSFHFRAFSLISNQVILSLAGRGSCPLPRDAAAPRPSPAPPPHRTAASRRPTAPPRPKQRASPPHRRPHLYVAPHASPAAASLAWPRGSGAQPHDIIIKQKTCKCSRSPRTAAFSSCGDGQCLSVTSRPPLAAAASLAASPARRRRLPPRATQHAATERLDMPWRRQEAGGKRPPCRPGDRGHVHAAVAGRKKKKAPLPSGCWRHVIHAQRTITATVKCRTR